MQKFGLETAEREPFSKFLEVRGSEMSVPGGISAASPLRETAAAVSSSAGSIAGLTTLLEQSQFCKI